MTSAVRGLTAFWPPASLCHGSTSHRDVEPRRGLAVAGVLACMVLGLAACNSGGGDGGDPGPPPTVLITPPPAVVKGASIPLSATVVDAAPGVTWLVEGGDVYGTITTDGIYTAPPVVPDGPAVVRATSIDDPRGTATATIRVIVGEQLAVQPNREISPIGYRANTLSGGQRSVAVFGSMVYLVWNDNHTGDDDVYLAVSRDRGVTFGSATRVNNDPTGPQLFPTVAVDGSGRAVTAWIDARNDPAPGFEVYVADASVDGSGAVTIGPNEPVTTSGPVCYPNDQTNPCDPSVALAVSASGDAYLAWTDASNGNGMDVVLTKGNRLPSGQFQFTPAAAVHQYPASHQARPAVAVGNAENVLVAWNDLRSGDQDVYWRRGTFLQSGAIQWPDPEVRVNLTVEGDQVSPSVAWGQDETGKKTAYVAWGQQQIGLGRRRLYFAKSAQVDLAFDPPGAADAADDNLEVIDPAITADQNFPSLAVNGAEVTIAFADNRNCAGNPETPCPEDPNGTGPTDVYVVRSVDGGKTFSASVLLNDDQTSSPHGRSSVAVDDVGRAYAIWTDDRSGSGSSQAFTARAE